MSYFKKIIQYELEDIVGQHNVTDKLADLDVVSTDVCSISRFWIDRGEEPVKPDYVVFPETSEQVSKILKLANNYKIPVTPRGGGAGDTCGALPIYGGIVLNMSKMDKIHKIDENNLSVTVETGIFQCDLEDALNRKGYTLNFFPASHYCSELGGFLANRGSGTLSSKYGKIENLVVSMEVVLPTGEITHTLPVPDHSTGPELNKLFLGSEGTLGVITNVTLKMFYLPQERRFNAFLFKSLPDAIDAGRQIMVNRLGASVIRVYDEVDTKIMVKKVLGIEKEGSFMVIGFDGFTEMVELQEKLAFKIIQAKGGQDLGREPGNNWWTNRFKFYYPPYNLEAVPVVHGVFDTCATFENILKIFYEQKQAIEEGFKEWETTYMGHFSHWYDYGTILYPTFIIHKPPEDIDELLRLNHRIWSVGTEIAIRNGGTVNEHHGIGLRLGRFMKENYGPGFVILQRIKKALDPNNIMNPGKMGFEGR
jgi:alkyldihydroxyacetonephosphate synthase